MSASSPRIFNAPNALTLSRLAALPITIALFRNGHGLAAAAVFLVAMLTDCLDGWVARRFNQKTALGMYLDPVVDKIILLSLFYELAGAGALDWAVAHLFLARELLQNAVRSTAASHGQLVGANWMGKTKALLQTALVVCGLSAAPVASTAGWNETAVIGVLNVAAWAALILSWGFFGVFTYWNRRLFQGRAISQPR